MVDFLGDEVERRDWKERKVGRMEGFRSALLPLNVMKWL